MTSLSDIPIPALENIQEAAERIKPYVHRTPVLTCQTLNNMTGADLFLNVKTCRRSAPLKPEGRIKIVVEPSGVVPLGTIMEHPSEFKNKRLGIILSGGNLDLENLPW